VSQRVCFVCLGNLCRSPTAEGVLRALVEAEGLGSAIEIDSAGTGGWHEGAPPDARATAAAARRGIVLTGRARPFREDDFARFEYVIAMDRSNLRDLHTLAPGPDARSRVALLRDFDPGSRPGSDVPDPYYGGDDGFDRVLDLCEAGCRGLLERLREAHATGGRASLASRTEC
jgi:protein-tyrosine phosphatase